ncbi:hypothetical protein V1509DRAFT_612357 [Lipomyces kononenkoae]
MSQGTVPSPLRSNSTPTPFRGACEQCYIKKVKCHFSRGQKVCSGCQRAGRACYPRRMNRMGRKPVLKTFAYGTSSIISLILKPPEHEDRHSPKGQVSCDEYETATTVERCWASSTDQPLSFLAPEAIGRVQILTSFCTLKPPGENYRRVNHFLATKEAFFDVHRHFMLGESFVDGFQTAVLLVFNRSPQILSDAYRAVLGLMRFRKMQARELDGLDLALGTDCLRFLTTASSSIAQVEDAAVTMMLGQILLVYNNLLPCSSTRTITRGALLSARDWYPALMQQPGLDAITLSPVLVDTIECLIAREMPVLRLPITGRWVIDRLVGVCYSFLPLLYDLCERSYETKMNGSLKPIGSGHSIKDDPYSEIEQKIKAWSPECPSFFFTEYANSEITAMLTQASSYRTAALLVIHRLRYPLGTEDSIGHCYANSILDELSHLEAWPPDGATGLGLDFPLLVAMMEIPGRGQEMFKAFDHLRFRQHSEENLEFVQVVRKAYESGYAGLWFDLVNDELQFPVLP